jgi:hypothetical protein
MFVALYDYSARSESELSFQKGDKLRVRRFAHGSNFVARSKLTNHSNDNENWWQAESLATKKIGYVPSNYIAAATSVEKNTWFHGKVSTYFHGCLSLLDLYSSPFAYSRFSPFKAHDRLF